MAAQVERALLRAPRPQPQPRIAETGEHRARHLVAPGRRCALPEGGGGTGEAVVPDQEA